MGVRRTRGARVIAASVVIAVVGVLPGTGPAVGAKPSGGGGGVLKPVVTGIEGPRGLALSPLGGKVIYGVADGSIYKAVASGHNQGVSKIGQVPAGFNAPAVDTNVHGVTFALTVGGPPGSGGATLYRIRPGMSPVKIKDIAQYQHGDPDPYNAEGEPEESNPYGLAALRDGSVLVADAAGNDLLRVWPSGYTKTVARIKPRVVPVPSGLPPTGPDGSPIPPAGTLIPSEGVATSVTVGTDGHYYVGELRGFPATPGTSQIWRIKPGSSGAVCDPAKPYKGNCQRYADGFTSIVDLGASKHHRLFVVELAKVSWFQFELGGSPVGSLYQLYRGRRHHGGFRQELVPGQLVLPGGVAASKFGQVYTSGPIFGPGAISRVARGG